MRNKPPFLIPCIILVLVMLQLPFAAESSKSHEQTRIVNRVHKIVTEHGNDRSFWGISVIDVQTRRTILSLNENRLFVPASILKILTVLAALETFGKNYRFTTEIATTGSLDASGTLSGPLILKGGGDPTWSFQFFDNDFEKPIQAFVDALLEKTGIQAIDGDIIADDMRFIYKPYGPSWSWEVFQWRYGTKVSALALNDNVMRLQILPGKSGRKVRVQTFPSFFIDSVRCETITRSNASLRDLVAFKPFDSDIFYLSGSFPAAQSSWNLKISVSDPSLYFGRSVYEELRKRGIPVSGKVRAFHRTHYKATPSFGRPVKTLAVLEGLPLRQILEPTLKKSVNLYAELLLRNMGVASGNSGLDERQAGIERIYQLWPDILRKNKNVNLADGSGLSRRNLISPHAITDILVDAYSDSDFHSFLDLLSVSGIDGTMKNRLKGKTRGKVFGKTGMLEQICSMTGYIHSRNGRWLAFCIIANNHPSYKLKARSTLDDIVRIMYNER